MNSNEIQKLKDKIAKDAKQSQERISDAQREIQFLVKERKDLRAKWENEDAGLEGSILELTNEVFGIQQRLLQAEELLRFMEQETD